MDRRGHARPSRRRPLALLALALAGLGAMLSIGMGLLRGTPEAPAPTPVVAPRPLVQEASPIPPPPQLKPRIAAVTQRTAATTTQAEICGYGDVAVAADDPDSLQGLPPGLRDAALDRAEGLMLASPDVQVRAAALLIGSRTRGAARARIDQLVRLATVSMDAAVYRIALEACQGSTGDATSACALLSLAQWARLEPDNVQPWLALAAEAQQRQDGDAQAQALRRAAFARRSETYAGLLPTLVDRALGTGAPSLGRTLAVSASWGVQAAWVDSHSEQAYAYCTGDGGVAAERLDTCEALAQTLAYRSASLADLGIGLAIGTSLGWPAPRLLALQQQQDAAAEANGLHVVGVDLSCEAIDRMQDWMRQLGAGGELQTLRDVLARSGRSIEDWSAQHRRNVAVATAAVEAAAGAAPAAPQ